MGIFEGNGLVRSMRPVLTRVSSEISAMSLSLAPPRPFTAPWKYCLVTDKVSASAMRIAAIHRR